MRRPRAALLVLAAAAGLRGPARAASPADAPCEAPAQPAPAEDALLERAACLDEAGRPEAAVKALRDGLERTPGSYGLRVALAGRLRRLGRYEEARGWYSEAAAQAPETAAAVVEEGYARLYSGDAAGAGKEFERAVVLSSGGPLSRHHLGSYYWHQGRLEEARIQFEEALRLFDAGAPAAPVDYTHALTWLARVYSDLGRARGSVAGLEKRALALSVPGSAQWIWTQLAVARIEAAAGRRDAAAELLAGAAKACRESACADEQQAYLRFELAALSRARGEGGKEERLLAEALSYAAESSTAAWNCSTRIGLLVQISQAAALASNEALAKRAFQSAIRAASCAPSRAAVGRLHARYGRYLLDRRDAAGAEAAFREAATVFRESGDAAGAAAAEARREEARAAR